MIDEEPFIPGFNAPDPQEVLDRARSMGSRKPLQAYMNTIVELRDKRASYRSSESNINRSPGLLEFSDDD